MFCIALTPRRWRSGFRTGGPSSKSCGKMGRFRRSSTWAQVTLLLRLLPRTPPGISPRINKLQETGTLTQSRPLVPPTPLHHRICPTIHGTHPRPRIYSQARSRNPITTLPWALVPFSSHKLGNQMHLLQDNELVVHIKAWRERKKHKLRHAIWILMVFIYFVDFRGALELCAERATNRRTLNYFSIYLFVLFAVTGQWDQSHAK